MKIYKVKTMNASYIGVKDFDSGDELNYVIPDYNMSLSQVGVVLSSDMLEKLIT